MVVNALEDIVVTPLTGELEQHSAELLVDAAGPYSAVAAVFHLLDMQAGHRVIGGEFGKEGELRDPSSLFACFDMTIVDSAMVSFPRRHALQRRRDVVCRRAYQCPSVFGQQVLVVGLRCEDYCYTRIGPCQVNHDAL